MKVVLASLLTTFIVCLLFQHFASTSDKASRETAYQRIMRTGTIRCGYINWYPAVTRDPTSGEMKGYVVDYMEAMAKALELKIVWAEEINLGTYLEDMKNGRYDLECAGGWPNAARGKLAYYTNPFAFSPLVPFVATGDTRFDNDEKSLMHSGLKAAVVDGDTGQIIRRAKFPNMEEISLPQLATIHEYFVMVAAGKADVAFSDYTGGLQYMQSNPGKIKPLPYVLRLVPQNVGVPQGDNDLLQMLNTANQQLILDGTVDNILTKYNLDPKIFIRAKIAQ